MKKLLSIMILLYIFFNINRIFVFGYEDCSSYKSNLDEINMQIKQLSDERDARLENIIKENPGITLNRATMLATRQNKDIDNQISTLIDKYNDLVKTYNDCLSGNEKEEYEKLSKLIDLFDKGYDAFNKQDYESSISYYKQYLEANGNLNDIDYQSAKGNLILGYGKLIQLYTVKEDYDNLLKYSLETLNYDHKNIYANMGVGYAYMKKKDYTKAKEYLKKAQNYNNDVNIVDNLNAYLKEIEDAENNEELLKNAPTNDILSGYQYYLKQLNIPNAWNKVKNNNQVIVAVIDDGININHPDLVNSIWVNKNTKYGDSKIIDFVGDGVPSNLPVGEHGTMVAGIIGATQNNNEGIAGISKNVKLMPLRVFDPNGGATEKSIINAMNYAIDNGANIINLSLGSTQFAYSTNYDEIIKRAFDNGLTFRKLKNRDRIFNFLKIKKSIFNCINI